MGSGELLESRPQSILPALGRPYSRCRPKLKRDCGKESDPPGGGGRFLSSKWRPPRHARRHDKAVACACRLRFHLKAFIVDAKLGRLACLFETPTQHQPRNRCLHKIPDRPE